MEEVILVDENDQELGHMGKIEAHLGEGNLHRAFTILLFNKNGETLVAQRSKDKMLWPMVRDSACASHPRKGEGQVEAGERRLIDELGFTCKLREVDKFQYELKYKDIGTEKEVCATLLGEYDGEIKPIESEVADVKWMTVSELLEDFKNHAEDYTIWFVIALERLLEQGKIDMNGKMKG